MISDYHVLFGFMSQEIPVTGKDLMVTLKEDTGLLDEVVVLGYARMPGNKTCQRLWVY